LQNGAFFDVDGTLIKGFIIQSFPSFLARAGMIDSSFSIRINSIISDYQSGQITYRSAAETVPLLYASALQGLAVEQIRNYAKEFVKFYAPKNQFSFAKELVYRVRKVVDVVVAVSGSPVETVSELDLGFDRVYGTVLEVSNGLYTGAVTSNLILGETKAQVVRRICQDFELDATKSMAFGDTDQDIPLLSMTGCPVAINPNKPLRDYCASKNWVILSNHDLKHLDVAMRILSARIRGRRAIPKKES
jgi:HAD superfamily hydrolase (TIGR01490 family)